MAFSGATSAYYSGKVKTVDTWSPNPQADFIGMNVEIKKEPEEHFAVIIHTSQYFRDLRDTVKDKISDCLIGTSANQLQLYTVDIPIGHDRVVHRSI